MKGVIVERPKEEEQPVKKSKSELEGVLIALTKLAAQPAVVLLIVLIIMR